MREEGRPTHHSPMASHKPRRGRAREEPAEHRPDDLPAWLAVANQAVADGTSARGTSPG